jgi:hypothetical protein
MSVESRYGKTLIPPMTLTTQHGAMEVSMHQCRDAFLREMEMVLPGKPLENLLCVPTMQHAREDLVKVGDNIEVEKDRLLENFMAFAKEFCALIESKGHFADYIDPCSGLAMITREANKVYSEVDGAQQLLGYSVQNAGCCKILLHPNWSSAVYPASIFTTAPTELVTTDLFNEAVNNMKGDE